MKEFYSDLIKKKTDSGILMRHLIINLSKERKLYNSKMEKAMELREKRKREKKTNY